MSSRGRRNASPIGLARGECPVCHTQQRLSVSTGKVIHHGRVKDVLPDGCPGKGQPPVRRDRHGAAKTGGTVVGWREGDPTGEPSARTDSPTPLEET